LLVYVTQYKGVFPPSNYYKGLGFDPVTGQVPTQPDNGYVHWSSFLYTDQTLAGTDNAFKSLNGWDAFQCPSLPNGGLPPANTYPGNNDGGLSNEHAGIIDWQAPRLAYTVNEALCPRGIFQLFFSDRGNKRVYRFVNAAKVKNSAGTVLASEIWGLARVMQYTDTSGDQASNTRRPVNGFSFFGTVKADEPYKIAYNSNFVPAKVDDLSPDPEKTVQGGVTAVRTTLDYIGRNHGGAKTLGPVGGAHLSGWDLRKSNFLYVDGHVETKHVAETVYPSNQWGDQFFTLNK
jgi:prepilin-type processing-associated H-X9-DG protein